MRWFRGMAMVLVGVMLFAIFGSAFAEIKGNTISPLYLYTRMVKASLSISDSGKATCVGYIKASNVKSDISMTVTLYKKSGTSWIKVTGWSDSNSGQILEIEKIRQVSEGTYKVVVTGTVTNSEGKKEEVKATSTEVTYSKK